MATPAVRVVLYLCLNVLWGGSVPHLCCLFHHPGRSTELANIISDKGAMTALPDNFLTMNGESDQQDQVDGRVFDSEMNRSFLQI